MARTLVPLAQGCEELEAVTIIDLLRRAGVEVVAAGLSHGPVKASRGVQLIPDCTLDDVMEQSFDMIVLPGGQPGSDNLEADERIAQLLQRMAGAGQITAAVCAAPKVLARAGVLRGRKATAYPGVLDKVAAEVSVICPDPVIQDGKVITSRGPGTAMDFSLTLIEELMGRERRKEVEAALVRP